MGGGSLLPATSPVCGCLSVAEASGKFWGFCLWRAGLGWTPAMRHTPFFPACIRLVWHRQGPIVLPLFHLGEGGALWGTSPFPLFSPALCTPVWYMAGLISSSPVCVSGPGGHQQAAMSLPSPRRSPTLPRARDPMSAPRAVSFCPGNATAGPVSSFPEPCPAQPWALPSWAYLWAHIPAWPWPWPAPIRREVPNAQGWGCPGASPTACSWLERWDTGRALADKAL